LILFAELHHADALAYGRRDAAADALILLSPLPPPLIFACAADFRCYLFAMHISTPC
jgi:hypothetical protein